MATFPARADQVKSWISVSLENQKNAEHHQRALANEGVGEHVRTRFHSKALKIGPAKLRTKIRTERRKLVSSAGPLFSKGRTLENTIQPFDLMSRRHPLSSTRAVFKNLLREANRSKRSRDVPASSRRQFSQSEIYFFFLATLRVFFAVFFTALFAFFAFLAFLAMLPS
jgi:hypothetical protein